ncbi:hypothetical protein FDP41_010646 [Naegleria fowleri]|uniref:NAD-dependent epimerase/dehydratase domain-containing protein n=1 Tax=Naegleria fowleri TaxID=5763 RepID=A0A6A5C8U7_NAEFO|nr:uncharacterized protein FDP41_010646 [Naegleria fowleri]KAF0983581.1 hypothetical protein FDP41_010646 [Naegleria fowleri]CAG4707862.1 unnamed protein product [Naegleria fowleri]
MTTSITSTTIGQETSVVCVTGANGYLGSHIVRELLVESYRVIGTIRCDPDSTDPNLTKKFHFLFQLPNATRENLKLLKADLLEEGSFDEAISQSHYVIHAACPFYLTPTPESAQDAHEKLFIPAVNGTKNVLNSVKKYRKQIKRVIVTSSTGALIGFAERVFGKVYDETDWNEKSTITNNPFAFSKTMAEKEAWKWHRELMSSDETEQHLNEHDENTIETSTKSGVELVSLNPVLILGPPLHLKYLKKQGFNNNSTNAHSAQHSSSNCSSLDGTETSPCEHDNAEVNLNFSCKLLYNHIMKSKMYPHDDVLGKTTKADGMSIVDVRDVARAHRLALTQPNIHSNRFVLVSEKCQWVRMSRIICEHFPNLSVKPPLQIKDKMDEEEGLYKMLNFSNAKFLRAFSIQAHSVHSVQHTPQELSSIPHNNINHESFMEFISAEKTIIDTVNSFIEGGLLS